MLQVFSTITISTHSTRRVEVRGDSRAERERAINCWPLLARAFSIAGQQKCWYLWIICMRGSRFVFVCVPKLCGNNGPKKKRRKEIPTGETVKHLLPLPHKHTHTGTQTEKEQDAEAAFESCPVAVNINSRWHVNIVPFWVCMCVSAGWLPISQFSHSFSYPSFSPIFLAYCCYCRLQLVLKMSNKSLKTFKKDL